MKKLMLPILLFVIILAGCSRSITSNEAEELAIQMALDEGYSNPKLYLENDNKTKERYHYSKTDEKEVMRAVGGWLLAVGGRAGWRLLAVGCWLKRF